MTGAPFETNLLNTNFKGIDMDFGGGISCSNTFPAFGFSLPFQKLNTF